MAIRWILTIISIIIFSWIADKMIKDKDLQGKVLTQAGLHINRDACMGCTLCAKNYPEVFEIQNKKAFVKSYEELDMDKLENTIKSCPTITNIFILSISLNGT
ncbi:ferredoxin [Kineothrix sp. MB12-C1]|uniref:ferredoxin n=1 Tax=Kineothrix sp. MB12-C1 TaxID=3070215 RepID=UPI0027D20A99|nr:ferredoxin [Kineothrix sp. MB12-C1]WMC93934.1 ferredoxin [Kineothrix sp. MB12-C1]